MSASRVRTLQLLLLALLALGALLRPMLVVACDLHAATHAHAADPHDHSHDVADGGVPGDGGDGDGHGSHDGQLLGSLAGAAAGGEQLQVIAPAFGPEPLPPARGSPPPRGIRTVPFRPPIG